MTPTQQQIIQCRRAGVDPEKGHGLPTGLEGSLGRTNAERGEEGKGAADGDGREENEYHGDAPV